MDALITCRF
uniref:Uncharacterized protein n=1 Tax=Macrostomum lignano TaxID=282301 RepID=A0A1I8GFW8_9PLAT